MSPTTLDSLNSFLAVNTDYTEMEEEPNYLASVDNPIMSIKTFRGKGHSFSQPRPLYQVRYLNRLLRFNYLYAGNLLCQCCADKLFTRLYKNWTTLPHDVCRYEVKVIKRKTWWYTKILMICLYLLFHANSSRRICECVWSIIMPILFVLSFVLPICHMA